MIFERDKPEKCALRTILIEPAEMAIKFGAEYDESIFRAC